MPRFISFVCASGFEPGFEAMETKASAPLGRQNFPIVHDRDKFSNREQSETNRNDENAICDYISEYLRTCLRLHDDSSRQCLNVLRTFCERCKKVEN